MSETAYTQAAGSAFRRSFFAFAGDEVRDNRVIIGVGAALLIRFGVRAGSSRVNQAGLRPA